MTSRGGNHILVTVGLLLVSSYRCLSIDDQVQVVPHNAYPGYSIRRFPSIGQTFRLKDSEYASYFSVSDDGVLLAAGNITDLMDTRVKLVLKEEFLEYSTSRPVILYVLDKKKMMYFKKEQYHGKVPENSPKHTSVSDLEDFYVRPVPANISYKILSGNKEGAFSFPEENQSVLVTTGPLDREATSLYRLRVAAQDGGTGDRAEADVYIHVTNANDNSPRFLKNIYHFEVPVNTSRFEKVGSVKAKDADGDAIVYKFTRLTTMFTIVPASGEIILIQKPVLQTYELEIEAYDKGKPPQYSESVARVYVDFYDPKEKMVETNKVEHHVEKRQARAVRPTKRLEYKESRGAKEGDEVVQLEKESEREFFKIRDPSNPWVTVETNGKVRVKKKWDYEALGPEKTINFWVEISNAGAGSKSCRCKHACHRSQHVS